MSDSPSVTIAIPTFNRARLLSDSLDSALAQDYPNLTVLVLDNASSDDTAHVVASRADPRVKYLRSSENIGLIRNWRRALASYDSDFVVMLQDDDRLLPGFVRASVDTLQGCPDAALSFTDVRFIDDACNPLHRQPLNWTAPGRIDGRDFLHRIVAGDNWVIHASAAMMRRRALQRVGTFEAEHSKHATEFNLYFRLAEHFDLCYVDRELCQVRQHPGQDHRASTGGTGPLSMLAERHDAVAYLLRSSRADEPRYRHWLAERMLDLSVQRSLYTAQLVPALNLAWHERLAMAREDIERLIPAGRRVIVVDDNQWERDLMRGYHRLFYVERNGDYWGPPEDGTAALRELQRLVEAGAEYMVVGWPAFWWLDYYGELRDRLAHHAVCVARNSRMIVFDVRPLARAAAMSAPVLAAG